MIGRVAEWLLLGVLVVGLEGCFAASELSWTERLPRARRGEFRSASVVCAGVLPGRSWGGLPMLVELSPGGGVELARRVCAAVSSEALIVVLEGRIFVSGENVDAQRALNFVRSEAGLPSLDVLFCSGRTERPGGRFVEIYEVQNLDVVRSVAEYLCRDVLAQTSWLDVRWRPMVPPVARTEIRIMASAAEHREICRYLKTVGEGSDCTLSDEDGNWLFPDGGVMED